MIEPIAVIVGASAGALLRYKATKISTKYGWTPYSTAALNMVGSFALGVVVAKQATLKPPLTLLLGTGFCGAFTTFSTFSMDVVGLLDQGLYKRALFLFTITNVGSVSAAFLAYKIFRKVPTK